MQEFPVTAEKMTQGGAREVLRVEELAKVQEHDGQAGSSTIICLVEKVQDGLVPVHFVVSQLVLKVLA